MRCTGLSGALAAALVLASAASALAGPRLEATARAAPGPRLVVTATNAGDATAEDVRPEVVYQRQAISGDPVRLAPGTSHTWELPLAPPAVPGTVPAIVRVRHAEAAGEVPAAALVTTPGAPASPVTARLVAPPLPRVGTVRLELENGGPYPVAGRVVVLLPGALSTLHESEPAEIAPGGRTTVPITVLTSAATPGTPYPVYAFFEHQESGTHYTVLAETTVGVVGGGGTRPLLVGAAALATMLALLAFALHRSRPGRSHTFI